MTTTVESSFGNGVMVDGFLLNNELTDFSFAATDSSGLPVANRVQANKRPRSSISPTIVFDEDGNVEIVTGSPGGSRIIGYTAQSIVSMIDFGLDPQQAINAPHYMNRNGRTDIEQLIPGVTLDYDANALATALKEHGHSDPMAPKGLSKTHTRRRAEE
jgi:gamma-glutamyltranspeptidase / glutathione hydrolase